MGAAPVRPPIPGYERVRTLRTVEDAARLAEDLESAPSNAVVIGAGFIGLEMAENLVAQGVDVTVIEAAPQVLPPLDPELAVLVQDELIAHGVDVRLRARVAAIGNRTVTLEDGRVLPADLVVGAIGVRPEVGLAELAGLELGPRGGIAVNEANQTSDPDIYAVGDAVEKPDAVSHATSLIALANVANRQGRRVADHIAGRPSHLVASLGTAIVKVFDVVAATVGWNERQLDGGRPCLPGHPLPPLRPRHLLPGGHPDVHEIAVRPGRRDGAGRPGGGGQRRRQTHRRDRHRHGCGHDRGPPGGSRTGLCPALLVGQGPRQPAWLYGRERAQRGLRRRQPRRARGPGGAGLVAGGRPLPKRSTPKEPSPARSICLSTSSGTTWTCWARARCWCTARSASGGTRRLPYCRRWA